MEVGQRKMTHDNIGQLKQTQRDFNVLLHQQEILNITEETKKKQKNKTLNQT